MFKTILLILIIITLSFSSEAKDLMDTEFDYKLGIGFNYAGLSSYYNNNSVFKGNKLESREITIQLEDRDSSFITDGVVNIDFTETHNNYFSEFKLADNLKLGLNLDLAYYSMENIFTFEDTLRDENGLILKDQFGTSLTQDINVNDPKYKIFRLMYINPSLDYYLIKDKTSNLRIGINALLPLSFDERASYLDDRFLGDGYLQISPNINFIQKFETTSLELGGSYISRSEIYSDLFNLNLGIYFTKVENTHFLIKAEYFQSLQEPNNQEFVISEFPSFESYLNMQFGLNVHFDKFELQFDYNYVPWGKSYWVMNRLNTSFHYFIK